MRASHGRRMASGPWLIAPRTTDYFTQFMDTRTGPGRLVTAGYGSTYTVLTVTTTADSGAGSLRAACLVTGPTIIRFAPGLGDIVAANRASWTPTSDTLIDGHGYSGTLYGSFVPSNRSNFVIMFCSVTQPFPYGANPSGPCVGTSNMKGGYVYHCNLYDSGDVLATGGAYQLTPNHLTDLPAPYYYTIAWTRLGPNPGWYGMLSPPTGGPYVSQGAWTAGVAYPKFASVTHGGRTWYAEAAVPANSTFTFTDWVCPGFLNGVDNNARDGKAMEAAYDHGWIEGSGRAVTVKFTTTHAFTVTSGSLLSGDGRTQILGAGIPKGSDGEGIAWSYIDATHGTLTGGTYAGALGTSVTDAQVYKPSSVPHPDDFVDFDHATYFLTVDCVFQGCRQRNGKSRSQYGHIARSLVTKYGSPYDTGGSGHWGQGSSIDDDAVCIHEGIVYIPYNYPVGGVEEQFVGFQDALADANGVPHIHATDPAAKAYALNGTAAKVGNGLFRKNWVPAGAVVEVPPFTTGWDTTAPPGLYGARVPGYSLNVPDMSVLANAKALVAVLEDNVDTRAGNPFSTTQPPGWRDVHTGSTFPVGG